MIDNLDRSLALLLFVLIFTPLAKAERWEPIKDFVLYVYPQTVDVDDIVNVEVHIPPNVKDYECEIGLYGPVSSYVPLGKGCSQGFSASYYLGRNFGTWKVVAKVYSEGKKVADLTSSFQYVNLNKIFRDCSLVAEELETGRVCELLGKEYKIEFRPLKEPVETESVIYEKGLFITHDGFEEEFLPLEGTHTQLKDGIYLRILAVPATVPLISLQLEYFDYPTTVKISTDKKLSLTLFGREKSRELKKDSVIGDYFFQDEKITLKFVSERVEDYIKNTILITNGTHHLNISSKCQATCIPSYSLKIEGDKIFVEKGGIERSLNEKFSEYFSIAKEKGFVTNSLKLEFKNNRAYFVSKKEVVKKILGIFPVTFVDYLWTDVESGAAELQKPRPWWSFLAF